VKAAAFDYVAPETVEQAIQQLARAGGEATILAGGQTLMPLLALRMSAPSVLVDVNRIAALQGVRRETGATRFGAMVRQNQILTDPGLAEALPVLVLATRHVGHHQTRNRGTLGGSVSLGEPAAELPAIAVALGAVIEASSTRGRREIPAEDFYLGPYSTVLEPDELVSAIRFPHWPAGTLTVFREIARRPGDFALVGLVGAIVAEAGTVTRAGLAWFGMGPTPMKARQAEAALVGQATDRLDVAAIARLAIADADPFDDAHATADHRREVGRRAFAAALGEALARRAAA
jgi:carbon-monoxide dehydrogenase medium subunit